MRVFRRASGAPTILFLHIGKCGGTSLREAVREALPSDRRAFIYDPADNPGALTVADLEALSDAHKRQLRIVMGHFAYGLDETLPQPSKYVTMVRNPVDRVASMWAFFGRHYPVATGGLSLVEWATHSGHLQTDNEMVRLISGRDPAYGEVGHEDLGIALHNLESAFGDVLVFERYGSSIERLERLLRVRLPHVERLNAAPQRTNISPEDRALIADANRYDMALYEQCVRLFDR
jgi:hypothetical protein